tara:strand:+ start:487 stop:702 length:216 start_codon:yes stop_codon:yes gene_type:complete
MIYILPRWLKNILILTATSLLVTSCASISGNNYCNIASPILLEEGDVDIISNSLSRDLVVHNTIYEKLCLK